MIKIVCWLFVLGFLAMPVSAQEEESDVKPKEARKEKERPPRIPDAPFVPRRGMVKREKGQFWAGPPDEGRFAQILLMTLVPREQLQDRLADAVARGMIQSNEGGRTTRGIFNFGANVSIDLGRESASAIAEFKSGLRTGSDIYAERGADWEASMHQRAIEAKAIQDLAKEYGVPAETISDVVPPAKPEPMFRSVSGSAYPSA